MTEASQTQVAEDPHKRPIAITIICILGFIGAALTLPALFLEEVRNIAPWYPVLVVVSSVIGLACMIGLWMMQKWAVYAYTALTAAGQVILIATGLWNVFSLILPAIIVIVMFMYLSRMR
jgi:hypothetical protein